MNHEPQPPKYAPTQEPAHTPEHDRLHDPPRIYVASLADYVDGRLHGTWLDAAREPDAVAADIQKMLARSPVPGAEEFAIHDFENFGYLRLGEYDQLDWVCAVARGIAEHGPAFSAWADVMDGNLDGLAHFTDNYLGDYPTLRDYATELLDDYGLDELLDRVVPESLRGYVKVDIDGYARDLELSGSVATYPHESGVWVFTG
ncbi:antirestriction protein ArdA [Gordonia sp. ABKF26]|uniref:antirestriction protein ArdA n=1 Tax=Gordonia sp. ABKF26 TaxID=3238687 RepID=UPI0034E55EA5